MGDYADYRIDPMLECRHPVGNWCYGKKYKSPQEERR